MLADLAAVFPQTRSMALINLPPRVPRRAGTARRFGCCSLCIGASQAGHGSARPVAKPLGPRLSPVYDHRLWSGCSGSPSAAPMPSSTRRWLPTGRANNASAESVLRSLRPGMLLLADRGFFSYPLWNQASSTGADLVWRLKSNAVLPVEKRFGDRSFASQVYPGTKARRNDTDGIPVRVVEYTLQGGDAGTAPQDRTYRLLATITDPQAAEFATVVAADLPPTPKARRFGACSRRTAIRTHCLARPLRLRQASGRSTGPDARRRGRRGFLRSAARPLETSPRHRHRIARARQLSARTGRPSNSSITPPSVLKTLSAMLISSRHGRRRDTPTVVGGATSWRQTGFDRGRTGRPPGDGGDICGTFFVVEPSRFWLIEWARLIDAGHIRPFVQAVFPLAQARAAFAQGLSAHP
jgi:hypothetical protein